MRSNLFLTYRLIFLSLLAHLHLLVIIGASWNIHASAAGAFPTASLFLVLTSCSFFLFAFFSGAISLFPSQALGSLKVECAGSAVLLASQLAATIAATVELPSRASAAFTSHSFLIPVAWLSALLAIGYLAGLVGAVMIHKPMYPKIWSATASSVDWFVHRTLNADNMDDDSWTRYLTDIESSAVRKQKYGSDPEKAPAEGNASEKLHWVPSIRRGVDQPFVLKREGSSVGSDTSNTRPQCNLDAALPPLPLRVETKSPGSRFIEKFRESQILTRGKAAPFPPRIEDHDKPIPLPRWSEWIRADSMTALGLHTEPQTP